MVSKRDFMMSSREFRHERKFLTGGTLLAVQTPRPELFHTTWPAGGPQESSGHRSGRSTGDLVIGQAAGERMLW